MAKFFHIFMATLCMFFNIVRTVSVTTKRAFVRHYTPNCVLNWKLIWNEKKKLHFSGDTNICLLVETLLIMHTLLNEYSCHEHAHSVLTTFLECRITPNGFWILFVFICFAFSLHQLNETKNISFCGDFSRIAQLLVSGSFSPLFRLSFVRSGGTVCLYALLINTA